MCMCPAGTQMGTYSNSIAVLDPHSPTGKVVNVDQCIYLEVRQLWIKGIRTTGCCCGHNINRGFIGVVNEDIPVMKSLGYMVAYNTSRPQDEDSFYPRSI